MTTSPVLMRREVILFIIIILMLQTTGAQSAIANVKTIFTIDVLENGNALWSEEIIYPLASQSAISEWNLSLKDADNFSAISNISTIGAKRSAEINERINRSLLSAMNYSGRLMSVRNLNITYDLVDEKPNVYGVVRLNFEWMNFSRMEGSNIIIGDTFSEGILPSPENVLIIDIPAEYDIVNATPSFDRRDGNRFIWDGTMYRSFGKGEPSLVLSRKLISDDSFPAWIAIILILVGGSILFLYMRGYFSKKKGDRMKDAVSEQGMDEAALKPGYIDANSGLDVKLDQEKVDTKDEPEVNPDEIVDIETDEDEAVQSGIRTDLPPITEDILGDEDMIEKYLKKCGGQAYQSDIVNESGLSKSKISIVLSRMKDEGRILKIRKGKENVIRLTKKD